MNPNEIPLQENIIQDPLQTQTWSEAIQGSEPSGNMPEGDSGFSEDGGTLTPIAKDTRSTNYKSGLSGWIIKSNGDVEFNDGVFRGTVAINSIDIPDAVTANSFHVDSQGNAWWGATTLGSAVASVTKAGVATFTNVSITGGSIGGSTTVGLANLNIANRGWSQTSAFSVTDADTVAWGAGTFTSADGTAYSIGAGNTGNMAAKTYIYLDTAISTTAYQTTTTASTAVGSGKVLIAIAQNGTVEATFTVLSGQGGQNIDASSIVANSITANELSTSITYAGAIVINTGGLIRSGQTAYNTGTGWWLGNDSGTPKFSIGNPATSSITWDGSALTVTGVQSLQASFTAQENLTAGMPVGIVNLYASKVARALVQNDLANGMSSAQAGQRQHLYCPIGGDKFAYLSYSTSTGDTLFVQVGSINTATNTPTLGTAATVATSITPNNMKTMAICKLDTDRFIVFYLLDASTTIIKYRVGTVTGTSISLGAETTFFTAASTVATSENFMADQIGTEKGIFVFKAVTTTSSKMICFTTSGDVATLGTEVTPGTESQKNVVSYVKKIGTDKFVLVSQNAADSVYAQVCTISTRTITAGTEAQISTTTSVGTQSYIQVISPSTDVFVVRYNNATTTVNFVACTVSGTTPTAGTPISVSALGVGGIFADTSTSFWATGGTLTGIRSITLSGTTLTDAGTLQISGGILPVSACATIAMDNGYMVLLGVSGGTTGVWIEGMSDNFIGIAQSTVSAGASVKVLVRGIDSNQSGLQPGGIYQVASTGLLTQVSPTATADQINEQAYVKAISSTQIII